MESLIKKISNLLFGTVFTLFVLALIVRLAPVSVSNLFLNPLAVVKGLQHIQEKEYKAERHKREQKFKQTLKENKELIFSKNIPSFGSSSPKTEVVVFFDYRCGYCKTFARNILSVMKNEKYRNDVRFIIRDLPVLSPFSRDLSILGIKAYKVAPGKFEEVNEALFSVESKEAAISKIKLLTGATVDLSSSAAEEEMIESNLSLARDLGIEGTPAIIIGDEFVGGLISEEQLKHKIDAIISK